MFFRSKQAARVRFAYRALLILFMIAVFQLHAPTAGAVSTIHVNTLSDNLVLLAACSLRMAIANANDNALTYPNCAVAESSTENDYIVFDVDGTIDLQAPLPSITDPAGLTIDGVGHSVTISGDSKVRPLYVAGGATLGLYSVSLTHGQSSMSGGALFNSGGAIYVVGTLVAGNVKFTYNNATQTGGALFDDFNGGTGQMTVSNSFFSNNQAGIDGGAIYNYSKQTLYVESSTFQDNTAVDRGGAIQIENGGANLTNDTFAGNTSLNGPGGAIGGNVAYQILNSTIAGNIAASGGSVFGNSVTLKNSIVANNTPNNCTDAAFTADAGNNISSDASCGLTAAPFSWSNTDPKLAVLADNGGPTPTMALLAGSRAIDGVLINAPNDCPGTDQRGITRPQDGNGDGIAVCDIGAYELMMTRIFLPLVSR